MSGGMLRYGHALARMLRPRSAVRSRSRPLPLLAAGRTPGRPEPSPASCAGTRRTAGTRRGPPPGAVPGGSRGAGEEWRPTGRGSGPRVPRRQQPHGAREAQMSAGPQGQCADPHECRAEQHDRDQRGRHSPGQGGQGDADRPHDQGCQEEVRPGPAAYRTGPEREGRNGRQAHQYPRAAADRAGERLADCRDQEGTGDDVADALQRVGDEQHVGPAMRPRPARLVFLTRTGSGSLSVEG